jgi:hypothetical protein
MKNLTYTEFKTKRINFLNNQPSYMQSLEVSFEESTEDMYNNYYLKGRVAKWAK